MKKLFFSFIFFVATSLVFAQGIYFSEPTSGQNFNIDPYSGQAGIPYQFYHENGIIVYHYYAQIQYPNGNWSGWQEGETGGWWVSELGEYNIEGEASVANIFTGQTYTAYRDPFSFWVVNNNPPPPQPLAVSISGPTSIPINTNESWDANTSGGTSPYSYQWYYEYQGSGAVAMNASTIHPNLPPINTWYAIGSNSSRLTTAFVQTVNLKCVVTDSQNNTVTSSIFQVTVQ